jgi:hypothetical protein
MTFKILDQVTKENSCNECPRNLKKRNNIDYKVLIPRTETSNIKYVFVSQDPAHYYLEDKCLFKNGRKSCSNGEEIRDRIISVCNIKNCDDKFIEMERISAKNTFKKGNVFNLAARILQQDSFDLKGGNIYWTHVLKCPPIHNNYEFYEDYNNGASQCLNYLKLELQNIKSTQFSIITIGKAAMIECSKIIGVRLPTNSVIENQNMQLQNGNCLGIANGDWVKNRKIAMYSFVHPRARISESTISDTYLTKSLFKNIRNNG